MTNSPTSPAIGIEAPLGADSPDAEGVSPSIESESQNLATMAAEAEARRAALEEVAIWYVRKHGGSVGTIARMEAEHNAKEILAMAARNPGADANT